ncbi:MAG: DNA polymerase IV, partial [Candidatus Berkelbacteria bacterium]
HIDMNSYFATVEQQSNPFLRGKTICVAGKASNERTICAALSIEAKQMGCHGPMPVKEAQAVCPGIIVVEADFDKYQYVSRKLFTILESYTPKVEIFSIDEAFIDLTGIIKNHQEAMAVAQDIKQRLKDEVGDYLTCSIGISHNKLLAKLASEMQKPDGLTIIDKNNLADILTTTPVEDVCGIGRQIGAKLKIMSIKTMSDLTNCSLDRLAHFFGPRQAQLLQNMGKGLDNSPVLPYFEYPAEKSYGHSYTLAKNVFTTKDAQQVLLKLSEKVGRRLRQDKVLGRTIGLYIKFFDFTSISEQETVSRFIDDGYNIYQIGLLILARHKITKPIRAVGINISNIKKQTDTPNLLLIDDIKSQKTIKATDKINNRYGEFTIFRASLTKIKDKVQNIPDGRNKRLI